MTDKLALHNILIEGCKVTVRMRATTDLVGVTFLEVTPILNGLFKGFSVEGALVFGGINPKAAAQGSGRALTRHS